MFYTRIPVPKNTRFSDQNLNKATRYFPLMGMIVGGIGALTFLLANYLVSVQISVLFSICFMVLITGAFHEDALADFCDGFGGGYSKEHILTIMKDSRIGTYGAIGLVFLLLSKFALLSSLKVSEIPFILIAAHALSRLNPVLMIFTSTYVGYEKTSKSKPVGEKSNRVTLIIALILGFVPLLLIKYHLVLPAIILIELLIFIFFRKYVLKKINGYTGDVLGALQQISEVGFYLTYIVSIKFL